MSSGLLGQRMPRCILTSSVRCTGELYKNAQEMQPHLQTFGGLVGTSEIPTRVEAKQQGQAAISLLESAVQVQQQSLNPNVGRSLDVTG